MYERPILLVEDNPDDQTLTLRAFKKSNIVNQVVVVRDGVEALDYLFGRGSHAGRDLSVQPALIMLDLKLPKVSGLEVLQALRDDSRTKMLPVVIFTSSKEQEDLVSGYGLGANGYVRKPVGSEEFFQAVQTLGLYWLIVNEPPPSSAAR